jgi:hypothetical protein
MYFRFGAAMVLFVAVSVAGVALEKQCLSYRRAIAQQRYRMDVLVEQYAQTRLTVQKLGAPSRMIRALEAQGDANRKPGRSSPAGPTSPLSVPRTTLSLPHLKDWHTR